MIKLKRNNLFIIAIIIAILLGSTVSAFAEPRSQWSREATVTEDGTFDIGLPDATMEDAEVWVERKGGDIISLLQTIANPLMIIVFIFGIFLAVAGGRKSRPAGIFMMIFSAIGLAGALFAPEFMDFFLNWVAS